MKFQLLLAAAVLTGNLALADIAPPTEVKCTVTKVTPEGARFFGFGKGPVKGDTTTLDLGAKEIAKIKFASGATIGSTITPHPILKKDIQWQGYGFYEATFKSTTNGADYHAVLVAQEAQPEDGKIHVGLDVLQSRPQGRLQLNSVDLECAR